MPRVFARRGITQAVDSRVSNSVTTASSNT